MKFVARNSVTRLIAFSIAFVGQTIILIDHAKADPTPPKLVKPHTLWNKIALANHQQESAVKPQLTIDKLPNHSSRNNNQTALEQQSMLSYAGGTVQLKISEDWRVSELPVGRQMRLILTKDEVPQKVHDLRDGLWINFQYQPSLALLDQQQLNRLAETRLNRASKNQAKTLAFLSQPIHGYSVAGHKFSIITNDQEDPRLLLGVSYLIQTQNGILEIYSVTDNDLHEQRQHEIDDIISGMQINQVSPIHHPPIDTIMPAEKILGRWKSNHGQLQFKADGNISVTYDKTVNYALDAQGSYDYSKKIKRLYGKFQAHNDLISITWADGSRLNYRWKADDGQLYLTDHHGSISQLSRLLINQ